MQRKGSLKIELSEKSVQNMHVYSLSDCISRGHIALILGFDGVFPEKECGGGGE
jgi:hypothetical protein